MTPSAEKQKPRNGLRSTVGRKVALGLTLTILLGVSALVYFEVSEQRKYLKNVSADFREVNTEQLGMRMAGGLRWNRASASKSPTRTSSRRKATRWRP